MTLNEFVQANDGKFLDFDGVYGNQCVDLVKYWEQNIGAPITHGNAIDYKENWQLGGYVWVDNTPTGVPRAGDIVVWSIKPNGHVAIFLSGDTNSFDSFDQNWPVGSPCHFQHHSYTNVSGWLHPMVLDPSLDLAPAEPTPTPVPEPTPPPLPQPEPVTPPPVDVPPLDTIHVPVTEPKAPVFSASVWDTIMVIIIFVIVGIVIGVLLVHK